MEKDWKKLPQCISVWNLQFILIGHTINLGDFPLLSVYHISFCAYPRSAKLESLRFMAKGAPYSNRKHCPWSAWNVSSIVQPLLKWLCDITWSRFDANLMAGDRGDAVFFAAEANSLWMHFQNLAEGNPCLNYIFDKFTQQYRQPFDVCLACWPIRADWALKKIKLKKSVIDPEWGHCCNSRL